MNQPFTSQFTTKFTDSNHTDPITPITSSSFELMRHQLELEKQTSTSFIQQEKDFLEKTKMLLNEQHATRMAAIVVLEDKLALEKDKLAWEWKKVYQAQQQVHIFDLLPQPYHHTIDSSRLDDDNPMNMPGIYEENNLNLNQDNSMGSPSVNTSSLPPQSFTTTPTGALLNANRRQNDLLGTCTVHNTDLDDWGTEMVLRRFEQQHKLIRHQSQKARQLFKSLQLLSVTHQDRENALRQREEMVTQREAANQAHEAQLVQRETQLGQFQTQFAFVSAFLQASTKSHPILIRPDNRTQEWYSYKFIVDNLEVMQQIKALTQREISCQMMGLVQVYLINLDRYCLLYLPQHDPGYYQQANHLTLAEQLWDPNGDLSITFACQGDSRQGLIPPLTSDLKVFISRNHPAPIKWYQIHGPNTFEATNLAFHHFVGRVDPAQNFNIEGANDPCPPTCLGNCTESRHLRHIAHHGFHEYLQGDRISSLVHIKWVKPGDPDYGQKSHIDPLR